ncbi:MAG: chorismate synthase [Rickettsiales bacterium]|jgi:chorismate synthase|nr:chorismate synthase [Rickettsiales bacterium]
MSGNTFGKILKVTTFGESHGESIGAILDGCPPNVELNESDIQPYLDKRKPGQNTNTTQRKESDTVKILSGVFEDKTTGAPIGLLINNENQQSKDYSSIANLFRPGHADYTYFKKYGNRDYRGGGRASARETAMRVATGAIARKIIPDIKITAFLKQIGDIQIENFDENEIVNNSYFSPDKTVIEKWDKLINEIKEDGDSIGGIVEVRASNIPVGLGEPIFDKLDAEIAKSMMSIGGVKGVEIGAGFESAKLRGSQNCDQMEYRDNKVEFLSNNAGGILGGISTGQDIIVRVAFKPTSSIIVEQKTITKTNENTIISTKGRHDPCIAIRGVPVVEAMLALVLADYSLLR